MQVPRRRVLGIGLAIATSTTASTDADRDGPVGHRTGTRTISRTGPRAEPRTDPADASVLLASADASIDSRDPDGNAGRLEHLATQRGRAICLLRFDPSGHRDDVVACAKLRLHASEGTNAFRPLSIYGISGQAWSEETVTWSNAPRFEGRWLETVDVSTGTGWYEADVTAYVNDRLGTGGSIDFRVENDSGQAVSFDAREAPRDPPELVLVGRTARATSRATTRADTDGASAWLRYPALGGDAPRQVRARVRAIAVPPPDNGPSVGPVLRAASDELVRGFSGLSGRPVPRLDTAIRDAVVIGTVGGSVAVHDMLRSVRMLDEARRRGDEGFVITSLRSGAGRTIVVASMSEQGALYGAFRLLQLAHLGADLGALRVADSPAVRHRLNNHWANFPADVSGGWGTVERGYSGGSFWQLDRPVADVIDRYVAYARINASVGINGTVLNNVNATDHWIRPENLPRIAEVAAALRPYGVRVHLSVRFDSPISLGLLDTADPLDTNVRGWWRDKIEEIYRHIPDFGGLLVKGDSEGQPGPMAYRRTPADGANMLADPLARHGGIVIWRAFVYGPAIPDPDPDRAKQAYQVFHPLDGAFADNVIVQTKNGPFDFQPREPVAPLLGGLPGTNTGIELPLMKEYTGHSYHANFLMPEFERVFSFDTHARDRRTTVAEVLDGSAFGYSHTLMSAVANYGTDPGWTRHPLDQANWFGFGRQAWNPRVRSQDVAAEWAHLTLTADPAAKATIVDILMNSGDIYASYAQPLGLPIVGDLWDHFKNEVSFRSEHNRDTSTGVGYDRTRSTGSGFLGQYHDAAADALESADTTPESLLLFLHHVAYGRRLPRLGSTVIQRIYDLAFEGVRRTEAQQRAWAGLEGIVDDHRWSEVLRLLERQTSEAINFRNVMIQHFFRRSSIADERGRRDAFTIPSASVPDQTVHPGDPVRRASATETGRVYLVPASWGGTGKWERESRFALAADGFIGSSAEVERPGTVVELAAPRRAGTYRLYAADAWGNISPASSGRVIVA